MSVYRQRSRRTRGEQIARNLEFLRLAMQEFDRTPTPEEVAAARAACRGPILPRQGELRLGVKPCR